MLKKVFTLLLSHYPAPINLVDELWNEIEKKYSQKHRHYHTLQHLENLLIEITEIKIEVTDWHTTLFSLFYHDIIYNPLKNNNEEKSAAFAVKRLSLLSVPQQIISNCQNQIIATKNHLMSADADTNYFIDADLSILGKPWEIYENYARDVRKEYAIYPAIIYNRGRKNVLSHFIKMDRIFKTKYFFEKYEHQAKQNLLHELNSL